MAASKMKMSLKLLIDTKSQKVVLGEGGEETVDFLFYILSLPLGTAFRQLGKYGTVGCLENLYESVDETYLPKKESVNETSIQTYNKSIRKPTYHCSGGGRECFYFAEDCSAKCPRCGCSMRTNMTYVAAPSTVTKSEGGFFKGVVTYMVTDDLAVKPMSTTSCISLLNMLNVKDVGALEEKEVDLGIDKALDLLIKSVNSKTVLTDVFLGNMGK